MSNREQQFLRELSELPFEDLKGWIREHSYQFPATIVSPFDSVNDPMNVLSLTLEFINVNRYAGNFSITQSYERALVEVFSEELFHPVLHIGIIYKYLSIFVNCPPLGAPRDQLSRILSSVVSGGSLRNSIYGARNLHYDALELLTRMWVTKDETFLGEFDIDDFLILKLKDENHPRFYNIALTYFKNTRKTNHFFRAFGICFELIESKDLNVISDVLIAMYWKDRTISWRYLANWLSLYSLKLPFESKFKDFCSYDKLCRLVVSRFEENTEINLKSGRGEGQYMLAAIVLLFSIKDREILSPAIVSEFFQNSIYGEHSEQLERLLDVFQGCTEAHINSLITKNIKEFDYPIIHICTLYQLKNAVYDENDPFELILTKRLEIEVDYEDDVLRIENMNAELSNFWFRWPIRYSVNVSIPLNDIRLSVSWWTNAQLSIANT